MLIDSHCHLQSIELQEFGNSMDALLALAKQNGVEKFLCVCVEVQEYATLCQLAKDYPTIWISCGIHPTIEMQQELPLAELVAMVETSPACIAIGETGLDYYRIHSQEAIEQQKKRFRTHIRAALQTKKPLIIHTREAALDTLRILQEENAREIGGVMHCFTETEEIAVKAMEQGFYISISGIVTFKSAMVVQEVAKNIPLDRLLIETDAPYLAPVPYRGKQNHPALVKEVALAISKLRGISYEELAAKTTENFYRCFGL